MDIRFGGTHTAWFMREHNAGLPSPPLWSDAVDAGSVGLLWYLQQYGIPCPKLNEYVQFAADNNRLLPLIFLLDCGPFIHDGGTIKRLAKPPMLDTACRENYTSVVQYVLGRQTRGALDQLWYDPQGTLLELARHGLAHCSVQTMVPTVVARVAHEVLVAAMEHRSIPFVLHCLPYTHYATLLQVARMAAATDTIDVIRACDPSIVATVYTELFNTAVSNGAVSVTRHLLDRTRPGELTLFPATIEAACDGGHAAILRALPLSTPVPPGCLFRAFCSGDANTVSEVYRRLVRSKSPCAPINDTELRTLIRRSSCNMIVMAYHYTGREGLDQELLEELISCRRHEAFRFFYQIGLPVDTPRALRRASAVCDVDTLSLLLSGTTTLSDTVLQDCDRIVRVASESRRRRNDCWEILRRHGQAGRPGIYHGST